MLQIQFIRENKEEVIARLAKKNMDAKSIVEDVINLDENRRSTQVALDNILAESNKVSKDIGQLISHKTSTQFSVEDLSTGLFIAKIYTNEGIVVKNLLKK